MTTYIAFIRGINVGGKNRLPMKDLTLLLESIGLTSVQTYIQSGNVIFRSTNRSVTTLSQQLAEAIDGAHGFRPAVVALSAKDLENAAKANPFGDGEALDKILHLYFLGEQPKAPDFGKMDAITGKTEAYALKGKVFYLYTPDGFGKSKLAQRAEKLLGVSATARNWRTVNTILEMARE